jgi:hypothetical protein
MSDDTLRDLWQAHREHQQRYVYFLLAAAGAAIGFAVTQTRGAVLEWTQIPLAIGVLLWGVSFYLGCRNLTLTASLMDLNSALIRVHRGEHDLAGRDPEGMAFGSQYLKERIEKDLNATGRAFRWQFYLLLAGAVFYVAWHVLEMSKRTITG